MADNFLGIYDEDATLETEGYEKFYSEDGKNISFSDTTDYSPPMGYSATGKKLTSHLGYNASKQMEENVFGDSRKVFGLPFRYTQLADPMSRVYKNTFDLDTGNIAFIKFGTPNINRLLYQKLKADQDDENGSSFGLGSDIMLGIVSEFNEDDGRGDDDNLKDQRLISFHEDITKFMQYAASSLSQVHLAMDLPGVWPADDTWKKYGHDGFPFYCVKTSAATEAVTNDYTVPDIIDQMNSDAAKKRQNYQLYGTYKEVDTGGSATSWLKNIATGALEKIKENIANMPIIGSVASVFMSTNKGSMSYYAKIWADSKTENSYSLSFKFRTPYGNKYDIFRNIYLPFLLLHTAALPKQDGRFSYQEPFMIQVDFPGWFRINCGVITNLSWVKGGESQLFSIDGLPLEMTVTMQVEDLYPIQLASPSLSMVAYNRGLLSFLESMAGVTVSQAVAMDATGWGGTLKQALGESGGGVFGTLKGYATAAWRHVNGSYLRD